MLLVIDIVNDILVEGTEDFNVTITSATLVDNTTLAIVNDTATVSIIDSMDGKLINFIKAYLISLPIRPLKSELVVSHRSLSTARMMLKSEPVSLLILCYVV